MRFTLEILLGGENARPTLTTLRADVHRRRDPEEKIREQWTQSSFIVAFYSIFSPALRAPKYINRKNNFSS